MAPLHLDSNVCSSYQRRAQRSRRERPSIYYVTVQAKYLAKADLMPGARSFREMTHARLVADRAEVDRTDRITN